MLHDGRVLEVHAELLGDVGFRGAVHGLEPPVHLVDILNCHDAQAILRDLHICVPALERSPIISGDA